MTSTLENVQQLITGNFTFLEGMGYTPEIKIADSRIFIESIDIEYVNTDRKRKVSINYNKSTVDNNLQYTFVVSIVRTPYVDATRDFFSLWIYLDRMGIECADRLIGHYSDEEADGILTNIVAAVKTHAGKIIEGTEWKEGYYPEW